MNADGTFTQAEARRLAREMRDTTDLLPVVDTVRETKTGGLIRGGFPHKDQTWAIYDHASGDLLLPVKYRAQGTASPPFIEQLRMTERDIAQSLKTEPLLPGGTTPEQWEKIRQWPGEFHNTEEPK